MLGKLKDLFRTPELVILAPVAGEVAPIAEVSDPTFSQEILGKGVAIRPSGRRVVSPVNGTISIMFDTGHAVSIISDEGTEVLVHVGLDTLKLKGQYYTAHVKNGDKVKAGDLLIEFDPDGIRGADYDIITPVIICNSADYSHVEGLTGKTVQELDEIIRLKK